MNENKVELLDYMGSDKSHSLAAWASTYFELGIDLPKDHKVRVDQIVDHILSNSKRMRSVEELLTFLATHKHTSPFRFSSFVFGMTTEIATHIQKLKHRILLEAENGESGRFKELKEGKFYLPKDWKDFGKKGEFWFEKLEQTSYITNALYRDCLKDLVSAGMPRSRAKETARFFKMYNSQINTLNKFSFDGVVQFASKRNSPEAQVEIRDVSVKMIDCIKNIEGNPFEKSIKAFGL